MANLGNTIINGILRVNGKLSVSGDITASSFTGNLIGNADTATSATSATKATQDGNGATISSTYAKLAGTQTFSGENTFSKANGFKYSGIETANGGAARPVWFNHSSTTGIPVINSSQFTYNPATNVLKVGSIDGKVNNHTVNADVPSSAVFTDTKVTMTNSTGNARYRLILSATADDTTRTETSVKSGNFTANPSTGSFYAKGYNRIDISSQTLDINTLNLSAGDPQIMKYIEKTSGGSNNITNIPVTGQPFLLDVELIRWASTTDYVTRQIFTNKDNPNNSYVRYCTNGTWSAWTTRVYTDKNVTISNTNPTAGTWYYPVWYTGTSGTGSVNANDGLRHYSLQGTASAAGKTILQLGNATATGTAGNKYGEVRIYAEKAGFATLKATASATTESVHTFPTTGGTLLNTGTTSFTQTVTAGTKIGAIKINGTSQDILIPTSIETANKSKLLDNLYTGATRPTSANVPITGSGGLATFKATNSMTTNKPSGDAHILHMYWDNDGGHDSQLAVLNGNSPMIQLRGQSATAWGSWITVPRSTNNSTNNIVAMSTADYNSVKDSLPNGSLVAVW